jgi:hypothetical protein
MAACATDDASYHIYLAYLSESAGDFAASERQLENASRVLREHPVPIRALCVFFLRRGRYREAVPLARTLVAIDPLREDFALLLLAALLGNREFEPAARIGRALAITKPALRVLSAAAGGPLILRGLRPLLLAWFNQRIHLRKELGRIEEYRRRHIIKPWRRASGTMRGCGSRPDRAYWESK